MALFSEKHGGIRRKTRRVIRVFTTEDTGNGFGLSESPDVEVLFLGSKKERFYDPQRLYTTLVRNCDGFIDRFIVDASINDSTIIIWEENMGSISCEGGA